ncbi:unnamed protein product, partial [Iphiclides podalirius]
MHIVVSQTTSDVNIVVLDNDANTTKATIVHRSMSVINEQRSAIFEYLVMRHSTKKSLEEKKEAKRRYMRERYQRIKNDPTLFQIEQEKEKVKYIRRKQKRQATIKYNKHMEQMGYRLQWQETPSRRRQRNVQPNDMYFGDDFAIA